MEDVPHSHTSSLTLAPIPAHPTTSSVSGDLSRAPSRASLIPASLSLESNAAKRDELRRILRDILPTKEICDRLMGHYFEKVEWSLNLLHRATFLRAYEAFWFLPEKRRIPQDFNYTPSMGSDWDNGLNGSLASHSQSGFGDSYGRGSMGGSDSGDKGSKSDSNSENNLSSAWISLLFALLCVAMERLGFYDSKALGIVEEVDDYKRLCKSLFEASQTTMVLGNFLNSKSIETVQTLILHLHCQQSVAETNWETHTAVTIAAAARIGNMMGLNKLTPEKPGPSRAPGFLKRELGRRAWWSLIEKDWSLSTRTGYTYAINPNQNFCDVPANLDWGEPEAVLNNSIPRSREIWTHASLFLAKADIAKANRELLDRYNSSEGVSYAFLMNHHAQLEQSLSRIPSALVHSDGDLEHTNIQVQWDRLLYTFHSHYSIILTHRPYIITALLDAKNHENEEKTGHTRSSSVYTNSLEASLRSAETILDTIEEAKALDYPGVQWWQTTLYCYVAAVVLLAERWYTSEAKPGSLKSEDAEERKRKIVAVIALLRDQGESIDLFSEAANALDSLLDATTSARRKARRSSSKRGMDITDVVNPINIPSRPGSNASTPSFVREWIERPNTPLSPPRLLPEHERSLSTISLTPGVALTADNSFDSHFWARVFDLQFGSPVAITDPFFPSAAKETNQNDAMEGVMGTTGGSMGMKNTAPLWNALSGQIGSMNPNERSW
ncbi:hypothetical protein CPB86DRAFT_713454 [Serendipita vermifera]|nr:hypothetical protein CPB86DRAFT_713454 [Serendipita vermifera]